MKLDGCSRNSRLFLLWLFCLSVIIPMLMSDAASAGICGRKECVVGPGGGGGGRGGRTPRTLTPYDRATASRREGESFLRQRDYLKAIWYFKNALKHTPGDVGLERLLSRALFLRGKEAASFGNFDETIGHVSEALKYTPGNPELIRLLGDTYVEKLNRYYWLKDYKDAIDKAKAAMRRHETLRNDPALLEFIQKSERQIQKIEMEKFRREEAARKAREGRARTEIGERMDRGILSRIGKNGPRTGGKALKQLKIADEQGKAAGRDTSPWGEGAKRSSNVPFDDGPPVHADDQAKIPPIGNAGPVELAKIDRYLDKNINSLDQRIRQAGNPAQKSKLLEKQIHMLDQRTKVLEQSIKKAKDPIKRSKLINKQTHAKSKKQVREIELMDLSVRRPKR